MHINSIYTNSIYIYTERERKREREIKCRNIYIIINVWKSKKINTNTK